MFSLIITIISIALVAALAVATIYYGGSAFTQGSTKASVATMISQAQQIAGAVVLYENDNAGALPTLANLSPLYLSAPPTGAWAISAGATSGFVVTLTGVVSNVCLNAAATNGPYACTGTTFTFND